MNARLIRYGAMAVLVANLSLGRHASRADETTVDGHLFQLPSGFRIERVAGPPLVDRPITAAFDEQGRMYVAESSGTNDPVQQQRIDRPHRILRLEDVDGDGRFDQRTVFAEHMMFPAGTLWHEGSLYVTAPPEIWKLTDTNDDGVADVREVWFDGKTLTNCANDLHGPYLGLDGLIYWCKGAFAEQTYRRAGKPDFKTRAAHIFRRRADGTGPIEPVMTGGMDNPVDVVFTPEGERIFTTTFLVHPGGGQRDGLIHAFPGAIYGKDHEPIHEPVHKWTSPDLMPPLVHLGPAAPAGLERLESTGFGPEYQHNLFAACFNLHKVTRHVLRPDRSTFQVETTDLLTSPDVDFHPTDVIEDADGSLLVINTGGWYKLCCPTSQLHKPDILGAIYRIRREGAPVVADARGLSLDWQGATLPQLVERLGDPRPAVRRRAIDALGHQNPEQAATALGRLLRDQGANEPATRQAAIWAACRLAGQADLKLIWELGATDPDPGVRQAMLNAVAAVHDAAAVEFVVPLLQSASDANRRAAAQALAGLGVTTASDAILQALARDNDRPLDHALTYALIESGDQPAAMRALSNPHPSVRRAGLVAFDQWGVPERLDPAAVAAWMSDADPALRESAIWVVSRHPEWGDALAVYFKDRLRTRDLTPAAADALSRQLSGLATSSAIQDLLGSLAGDRGSSPPIRSLALQAMARATLEELPVQWTQALIELLASQPRDNAVALLAIQAIQNRAVPENEGPALAIRLNQIGHDVTAPDELRLAALRATDRSRLRIDAELFQYLASQLDPGRSVATRLAASDVLTRSELPSEQLIALAAQLKTAGPLELTRLLPAFGQSNDPAVGSALLAALSESQSGSSLRAEQLDPILVKYPQAILDQARAWIASNQVGQAEQHARIEKLLSSLPTGDAARGHQVFAGSRAACSSCHAMGYLGGRIGPDLTKIGQIRTDRDLLEAIVVPSASFVRSYEPVTVSTLDGRIVSGTVKKDTPDELVLTLSADLELRLPRAEIEEIQPGTVSIMPAGLEQQLSPQELADLIAFLKSAR